MGPLRTLQHHQAPTRSGRGFSDMGSYGMEKCVADMFLTICHRHQICQAFPRLYNPYGMAGWGLQKTKEAGRRWPYEGWQFTFEVESKENKTSTTCMDLQYDVLLYIFSDMRWQTPEFCVTQCWTKGRTARGAAWHGLLRDHLRYIWRQKTIPYFQEKAHEDNEWGGFEEVRMATMVTTWAWVWAHRLKAKEVSIFTSQVYFSEEPIFSWIAKNTGSNFPPINPTQVFRIPSPLWSHHQPLFLHQQSV